MRHNGFQLDIMSNGSIISEMTRDNAVYIPLPHESEYQIVMQNNRGTRCTAVVSVDGQSIGTFVLDPWETLKLERSAAQKRKFVFLKEDSTEARSSGATRGKSTNGLVTVEFTPEFQVSKPFSGFGKRGVLRRRSYYDDSDDEEGEFMDDAADSRRSIRSDIIADRSSERRRGSPQSLTNRESFSSGVTAYGSSSDQVFTVVAPITNLDSANRTELSLRLVNKEPKYVAIDSCGYKSPLDLMKYYHNRNDHPAEKTSRIDEGPPMVR
jgi:phage terminase large subunit-like protein